MSFLDWLKTLLAGVGHDAELPEYSGGPDVAADVSALTWPALRTASAMYVLLYDFSSWVHRRVEYINFIDDTSVTRRVSIDFAVPEPLDVFDVDDELLPCVPLTFLLKGDVLRNFDLRDAEGNPVPMLTKKQNGHFAGNTLIYLAEEVLGQPLTRRLASLEGRLRLVAESRREEAEPEIASWRREANDEDAAFHTEMKRLVNNPAFIEYAQTLAENYILFAVGPPKPNERRLMKFGYEEQFKVGDDPGLAPGEKLPFWERWQERLGWRVKTVNLAMPAVNLAASFHVEIPAPPEMEVQIARLVFKPWEPAGSGGAASTKHPEETTGSESSDAGEGAEAAEEQFGESASPPEEELDGPAVQRVHLYKAGVSGQFVADAVIYLRARRAGFLLSACLTGWLNVFLLAMGLVYLSDVTADDNSQTAAALLLLGPTFLAGNLIRPGEHRMVASVLIGVRLMLLVAVVSTVFAVGVLAGAAACVRCEVWAIATVVAALMAIGLTASYVLPKSKPRG